MKLQPGSARGLLALLIVGGLLALLLGGGAQASPLRNITNFDSLKLLGSLAFEGATVDGYATSIVATDPTADRTITLPNASGTVALNPYGASIEFEGAVADDFETTLSVAEPTADRTVTLPDASGTVMLSSLATNAPDAANSVTGASNALVFEGASADDFETSVVATNPTADRTITLPDASGTVALTSQADDITVLPDASGGNAGAKNEFVGLPRIKLVGLGSGTNPNSQTISLADDSPEGEYAALNASVVASAESSIYKVGSHSLKMVWAADAAENDGVKATNLFAGASLEDQESVGLWLYSSVPLSAGDLQIVIKDDGGDRKFDVPAVATVNKWTWVEIDISALNAGTGDACSDFSITLTAQGAAALNAPWTLYFDTGWVWDAADEADPGVSLQQDGVLGVVNTTTGAPLVDGVDYFVHMQSGDDAIVYITNQSAATVVALIAY